jgi:Chloramphenicol 3-O-phosphotransferase
MEKGKIIWLNGVSSSGKTTLAKTLQDLLPDPPYYISNDLLAEMIPPKHFSDVEKVDKAFSLMYNIIKTFSDAGVDVVVDSLFLSAVRMNQCVEVLYEYPVLFVHVTCSLDELRRREEKRGDREVGQGESQLSELAPQDNIYDITVDTSNSKDECVDKIIELQNCSDNFTAFKTLWSQH